MECLKGGDESGRTSSKCELDAPADVIRVSKREDVLVPFPPPGSDSVVVSR